MHALLAREPITADNLGPALSVVTWSLLATNVAVFLLKVSLSLIASGPHSDDYVAGGATVSHRLHSVLRDALSDCAHRTDPQHRPHDRRLHPDTSRRRPAREHAESVSTEDLSEGWARCNLCSRWPRS